MYKCKELSSKNFHIAHNLRQWKNSIFCSDLLWALHLNFDFWTMINWIAQISPSNPSIQPICTLKGKQQKKINPLPSLCSNINVMLTSGDILEQNFKKSGWMSWALKIEWYKYQSLRCKHSVLVHLFQRFTIFSFDNLKAPSK